MKPPLTSTSQAAAALLLDLTAAASAGEWGALCWCASTRLDAAAYFADVDAAEIRAKTVDRFLASPSPDEIDEEARLVEKVVETYEAVRSIDQTAELCGISASKAYRVLRREGVQLAAWGRREGQLAA